MGCPQTTRSHRTLGPRMYKKIMVPVDLSHRERLEKAVATAADLSKCYKVPAEMVAVTATAPGSVARNPEELADKLARFAAAVLKVQVPAGSCTGAPMEAGKAAQPSSPSVRVTTTSSMDSVPSLSAPPCVAGWSVSGSVTPLVLSPQRSIARLMSIVLFSSPADATVFVPWYQSPSA